MSKGIIIYGASGSGKTTVGKALAQRLNFQYFDFDDYFWNWDTEIPYTVTRPREEVIENMTNDMMKHPHFVLSGSMGGICKSLSSMFGLAILITVPTAIRIERLRKRESDMFGERILEGGDMYEQNLNFFEIAKQYDTDKPPSVCLERDEQWITEAPYPVLRLDGTKGISENVEWIAEQYAQEVSR